MTTIACVTTGLVPPSLSVALKPSEVLPFHQRRSGTKTSAAAPALAGTTLPTPSALPPAISVPCSGRAVSVKLAIVPSMSEPPSVTGTAAPSLPLASSACASGISLAPLTLIATVRSACRRW